MIIRKVEKEEAIKPIHETQKNQETKVEEINDQKISTRNGKSLVRFP